MERSSGRKKVQVRIWWVQFLIEPDGCAISKFLNVFRTQSVYFLPVVVSHLPASLELRCGVLQSITSRMVSQSFLQFSFCVVFIFIEVVIALSESLGVLWLLLHLQLGLNSDLQKYQRTLFCFQQTIVLTENNILCYAFCLSVSANILILVYISLHDECWSYSHTYLTFMLSCMIWYSWEAASLETVKSLAIAVHVFIRWKICLWLRWWVHAPKYCCLLYYSYPM